MNDCPAFYLLYSSREREAGVPFVIPSPFPWNGKGSRPPIGEPVAWYGPIVMNTEEELRVAFEEYRRGTFIKGR